jgi:hypothetical protein
VSLFQEYRAHGWQLCDIPSGTKGPTAKGWNERGAVAHGQGGLGLCHAYSGTCSVDIDDYPKALDWFATKGIDLDALLMDPRSVQIVSGKVNRAKLLYKLAEPLPSCSLAPYKAISKKSGKEEVFHALELRCATKGGKTVQDVLPPTIHPETQKPYIWAYGDETFGHWSVLPELPSAIAALWKGETVLLPGNEPQSTPEAKGTTNDELIEKLRRIDPNEMTYDDWLKVGMGIHHETGGQGYKIWRDWSARSTKHDETHMVVKWKSFHSDAKNPVTIGSALREQVAAPNEFDTVGADVDVGDDTRPEEIMKKLLESRLVFVRSAGEYFDLQHAGGILLPDRSIRHIFTPFVPWIKTTSKKTGEEKTSQPDPVNWLKSSKTKLVCDQVGIHPGAGRKYREDGLDYVNRYVPEVVEPLAPKPHERDAIDFLWSRISDPKMAAWLMRFYAFAMRNPGVKIQSAPLLVSAETGTGKNTLARTIPELIFGRRWVRTVSGDVLGSSFTDVLGETWWLYLEELKAGGNKLERIALANKMKSWITDSVITVHPKGLKPYDVRNRVQPIATSNFDDDAVHIDGNDRRWGIMAMVPKPFTEREALDVYSGFLQTDRAPGVWKYFFDRVDLTGFNPTARAPQSDAKAKMVVGGIGSIESRLVEAMVAREAPFDRDVFRLKDVQGSIPGLGSSTATFVATQLKRLGAKPLRGAQGIVWVWNNLEHWRKLPESARINHLNDASRPTGVEWNLRAPAAVLAMSAEGGIDSPPADNSDLLG